MDQRRRFGPVRTVAVPCIFSVLLLLLLLLQKLLFLFVHLCKNVLFFSLCSLADFPKVCL